MTTHPVTEAPATERVPSSQFAGLNTRQRAFSARARAFNVVVVVLPFVGFLLAVILLWNGLVGPIDLALIAVMWFLTTLGVGMGFHRLLTHRSFATKRWIELTLAGLGSMAVQGPPVVWVSDHRKHHAFTDEEGDPHSPHGTSMLRGLYHAHVGWLISRTHPSDPLRYARDLIKDPAMRRVSQLFPVFVGLGLLIPAVAGGLLSGTWKGVLTGFIWGGLVRIFLVHHITWSVNSLCHYVGRRRFATSDHSSNIAALAIPSLGDSWHHNHHAFPRSARHGLRWWELDVTGLLIQGLAKVGLAWNIVSVAPEQLREKEAT